MKVKHVPINGNIHIQLCHVKYLFRLHFYCWETYVNISSYEQQKKNLRGQLSNYINIMMMMIDNDANHYHGGDKDAKNYL